MIYQGSYISIHLLRAEQDAEAEDEVWELRISIHLLRAEQDYTNISMP